MTATALILVAAAALLHAAWNALAKRSVDPVAFFCCTSIVAALVLAAPASWVATRGGVSRAGAPWVVATILLHTAYFYSLARAYMSGAYSVVYPVARGLGVALVPVLGWLALGERVSTAGALGIALVVLGIGAVQVAAGDRAAVAAPAVAAAVGWAAATGVVIAAYSLVDKAGVARMHPVPYLTLMEAGTVACLAPTVRGGRGTLVREWRARRASILLVGAMSGVAYLLVLFAFQLSKAAYVVACREISIVVSALIGSLWLREGRLLPRLGAAAVILGGVVCVALAR